MRSAQVLAAGLAYHVSKRKRQSRGLEAMRALTRASERWNMRLRCEYRQ
jgi:hypothetical protein